MGVQERLDKLTHEREIYRQRALMLRANQDRSLLEQQHRDRFNLNRIAEVDQDTADNDPTDQLSSRHEDGDASRVGSIMSRADTSSTKSHHVRRSSQADGLQSKAGAKGSLNVSNMSVLSSQRSLSHDGGDGDISIDLTHQSQSQLSNSIYRASSAPVLVGARPVDSKDVISERPITVGADAATVLRNNSPIKSKTAMSLLAKHNNLMDDSLMESSAISHDMIGRNESRLELSRDYMDEGDSDQAEESELIDDDAELQAYHRRHHGYNDDVADDEEEEEESIQEDIHHSSDSRRILSHQLFPGDDTLLSDNPSHQYSDDFEHPEYEDFSEADEAKDTDRVLSALTDKGHVKSITGSAHFNRPLAEDVAFWSSLNTITTVGESAFDLLDSITRSSSNGSTNRDLRGRLEYVYSEFLAYWQQGSNPVEGLIDPEALTTMMNDAMAVCKRAIEYSIAVVNLSLERPKEPSFFPDHFPQIFSHGLGIDSQSMLLRPAIIVCAAFCSFVPSFISICEHLIRVCEKTDTAATPAVGKVSFIAVLASCAGIIGSAIYLPQDDELHSSKPFQASATRWAINTADGHDEKTRINAGATRMDMEVLGLSISDKWCLMALLAELLKGTGSANKKYDGLGSVLMQTLQSLNTLLSHASLSTFNMIVAQQIPSLVCASVIDKVYALYKHAAVEATAGNHTGSKVGVMKGLLLNLAHAYSLLLSPTTTPSWGIHCPIPGGIGSTSSQDYKFETYSSQVMLRLRVCRGMTDKLCHDDTSDKLCSSGLHKLLLLTCELFSDDNALCHCLPDQFLAFIRTDLINTLLHLTELNGKSFCAAISDYNNGRMVDCLMKQLKGISSTRSHSEEAVRSSMSVLVLTRLLASQSLTGDTVVGITSVVVTSVEQMSRRTSIATADDHCTWSKMFACFDWLAELTRTLIRLSDTHNERTHEEERQQLLSLVERLTGDDRFVEYLVRVFQVHSKHRLSDGEALPESYPSVQFTNLAQYGFSSVYVWNSLESTASVMGCEFGVRLHGCLDGLCELIAHAATLCHANAAIFDIHSAQVTNLVETLCCAISQGVSNHAGGGGEAFSYISMHDRIPNLCVFVRPMEIFRRTEWPPSYRCCRASSY